MMQAKMLTRGDGRRVYEVLRSGRRWVVTHHVVRKTWWIENEHRTRIDPDGLLGEEIIEACARHFEMLEPAE